MIRSRNGADQDRENVLSHEIDIVAEVEAKRGVKNTDTGQNHDQRTRRKQKGEESDVENAVVSVIRKTTAATEKLEMNLAKTKN
jgi:hypothetical protein